MNDADNESDRLKEKRNDSEYHVTDCAKSELVAISLPDLQARSEITIAEEIKCEMVKLDQKHEMEVADKRKYDMAMLDQETEITQRASDSLKNDRMIKPVAD